MHPMKFLALLAVAVVVGPSSLAGAASCVLPPFKYGQCFVSTAPHPGEYPFAATYVEGATPVVIVPDLFSGYVYRYSFRYDAAGTGILSGQTSFIAPLGAGFTTGVAWHKGEDKLYWLIDGHLVRSSLGGAFDMDFGAVPSPQGGTLGDLAFASLTGTFWTVDLENDIYFEFAADPSGPRLTGSSFVSPTRHPDGGGAYGGGLAYVEIGGTGYLDIVVGWLTDLRAVEVRRVTLEGKDTGYVYSLAPLLSGFPGGIAYRSDGTRDATEFVVDGTANLLVELPAVPPAKPGVADLACQTDAEARQVTLAWRNPASFATIEITRAVGTETKKVATLAGNETQWTDANPPAGVVKYTVAAEPASGAPTRACEAVVGFGHLVRKARHLGNNPFAVTIAEAVEESPARVIVAELTGDRAYLYTKELEPAGTIPAPLPASRTLGIAWESSTDRLLWVKESSVGAALVYTDREGQGAGSPILFAPPYFRAALGDIAHDPNGCREHEELGDAHVCPDDPNIRVNFYWAVDVANDVYFEFKVTEDLEEDSRVVIPTGRIFNHPAGRGYGDGIAGVVAVDFTVFDIPVGAQSLGYPDRVVRMLPSSNAPAGQEYGLRPTTGSAFIEGIAWTAEGSRGKPAEYAVGNDTDMIYEFSLESIGGGPIFIRGDANGDNRVNISDPSFLLQYLFNDGRSPGCLKAADANDDGRVNISDPSYLLSQYLFADSPVPPPAPFPLCGPDPTEDPLGCESYTCP